jgi:hypothetical protein
MVTKREGRESWTIVSKAGPGEGVDAPEDEGEKQHSVRGAVQAVTIYWTGNGYNRGETWIRFDPDALVEVEE